MRRAEKIRREWLREDIFLRFRRPTPTGQDGETFGRSQELEEE